MNKKLRHIIFISIGILLFTACNKPKESKYHSVIDRIDAESKNYPGSITSDPLIEELDLMEVTAQGKTFLIPKRKEHMTMYACNECHSSTLEEMQQDQLALKRSHWDITLEHGNAHTMNCITCHNGATMNELHSLTGEKIDFNQSYLLCAQCHNTQFKDWAGGAHGKNIGGWAAPRAINTCVNCHNPHKPAFEKRLPSTYNKVKEMRRK